MEQERELGVVAERRLSRGFKNLHEPSEEEAAIIFDGGRLRALAHMDGASTVGRMPWAGEATGMTDRLAQQFGMDRAWWEGLTGLMREEELDEAHRAEDRDDAGSCSARAMSISPDGSPMVLSSQVSQASPCPDHLEQEQVVELELSTTASATGGAMEGNERRVEAEALRPTSPSSPSPEAPPVLHRGRRSRALCPTDEDLKLLGKTVARLDFGSDDEQATDADARQAEAVAGAACGGDSVHDVSSGSVHADRGAASGVGGEHSVPVRYDEVEHARDGESASMEHGERGERGDTGERRESGEEDEGEDAAGNWVRFTSREGSTGSSCLACPARSFTILPLLLRLLSL